MTISVWIDLGRQCCGSGMVIQFPDLYFLPSRILDPRSNKNKREEGENVFLLYFFSHKFPKILKI
jgi:hypothetical protein